jgi:glycosyltransferase involved in cell wall biosynthesis
MSEARTSEMWSPTSAGMWLPHPPVPSVGEGRRILHVSTRFLFGGAERNVAHSIAWEMAAGFQVELAVGADSELSNTPADLIVHRLKHLRRSVRPLRDVRAVAELRRLMRARRYEIVHTHQSKAGIVGRIAARGVARHVAHTVHMASFGESYGRMASRIFKAAERFCARETDVIAFVGTDLMDLYIEGGIVDPIKTMVIRSPIDVESFLATRAWPESKREAAATELGLGSDRPILVAIGAFEPRKRYDLMLMQLAPLLRDSVARLVIAGKGKERHALEKLARGLQVASNVVFLGHLADVSGLLARADVLVHTSSVEGVAQVVIQALAAGRPVVATDATGLREVPGAMVAIVPADGDGFDAAVQDALTSAGHPPDPSAFGGWLCPSIDSCLHEFHDLLAGGQR